MFHCRLSLRLILLCGASSHSRLILVEVSKMLSKHVINKLNWLQKIFGRRIVLPTLAITLTEKASMAIATRFPPAPPKETLAITLTEKASMAIATRFPPAPPKETHPIQLCTIWFFSNSFEKFLLKNGCWLLLTRPRYQNKTNAVA